VDGGLAYGCNQSFQVASAVPGGVHFPNEALRCEAIRGGGSRRRRKDRFPAGGVRNTTLLDAGSDARKGVRDPRRSSRRASPRGSRCAIPARESGRRATHLLSNEGALDREKLRRVTAAGWKRSWRASPNRLNVHRERHAPVSSGDRDRGVRGRSSRAWASPTSSHSAKPVR